MLTLLKWQAQPAVVVLIEGYPRSPLPLLIRRRNRKILSQFLHSNNVHLSSRPGIEVACLSAVLLTKFSYLKICGLYRMGYYETMCQLCGVSFAVARNRRADAPLTAPWDYTGSRYGRDCLAQSFRETCGYNCDCELLETETSGHQHISSPECASDEGYSGHRISLEEMKGCRAV